MRRTAACVTVLLLLLGVLSLYAQKEEGRSLSLTDAMGLARNGKYDEAVTEIKRIILQAPGEGNVEARLGLGLVYFKSGQYDLALGEFARIIALKKESPMAYYFMGLIYEKKAVGAKSGAAVKDLKQKALEAWRNYLSCADRAEGGSASSHGRICVTAEKSRETARKHVALLEEDLGNEY